jgi:cytochrome c oxidase assembly protein subunit 15
LGATVLIFAQLVIGATMRHQHAGLAVPDFPLAYGKLWPPMDPAFLEGINQQRVDARDFRPITAFQVALHMTHRIVAVVILVAVVVCARATRRHDGQAQVFRRLSLGWLGLIVAQGILGALTVIQDKPADIATLHVMIGAAALAAGVLLTILAFRFSPAKARAASRGAAQDLNEPFAAKPDGVASPA